MAYTVFARRYRPLNFREVVGQDHVTVTLTNALKKGKVAHAYLFAGPRGIGKTTTARILAKAINCSDLKNGEPCNKCPTCKDINDGRSLDVLEIDGASNRGIDEIRNLRENVKFAPSSSPRKVYIIDEVHQLTSAAFNALLKTLEEPPAHVLFVFATTEAHQVPPTILSRCQRFDFHRISAAAIRGNIEHICQQEKVEAESAVLDLITRKADGSLRDAQSLLDQLVAFCGEKLEAKEVEQVLGLIPLDTLFEATKVFRERDSQGAFRLCDRLASQGADYGHFLRELAQHLVRLVRVKTTGQGKGLEVSAEVQKRYESEAEDMGVNDLFRWLRLVQDSELAVKRSPAPRIRFETDFLKVATLDSSVDLQTLLTKLDSLGEGISEGVERLPQDSAAAQSMLPMDDQPAAKLDTAAEAPSVTKPPKSLENQASMPELAVFQEHWEAIGKALGEQHPFLGIALGESYPTDVQGKTLTVVLEEHNGFHLEQLRKGVEKVQEAIGKHVGVSPVLDFVQGELPEEVASKGRGKAGRQSVIEKVRKESPAIRSFLDRIDGKELA
jgi:DNA polymerase-3 subunit gamma/tau